MHDSMSHGSNEYLDAQVWDENSNARLHNENSVSANDQFSEVFGFVFRSWSEGAIDRLNMITILI